MIPITQDIVSSLDGKIKGNCFRACLASILEVGIHDIPAIEAMDDGEWFMPFYKWLQTQNAIYVGHKVNPTLQEIAEYEGIDGYKIIAGKSPRPWVTAGHAVVFHGNIMVHDPHPSREGILSIDGMYLIERISDEN